MWAEPTTALEWCSLKWTTPEPARRPDRCKAMTRFAGNGGTDDYNKLLIVGVVGKGGTNGGGELLIVGVARQWRWCASPLIRFISLSLLLGLLGLFNRQKRRGRVKAKATEQSCSTVFCGRAGSGTGALATVFNRSGRTEASR